MRVLAIRAVFLATIVMLPPSTAQAQLANDAQREQVAANFREADADDDGALTRVEFTKLIDLNARHDIGRARLIAKFERYDIAFDRADADADGSVTLKELSALATKAD